MKSQRNGHINTIFADTDRIDIIAGSSSHSDLNSTGSQNFLTDSQTNYRFTSPNVNHLQNENRVQTPSNMVRRWSQNISKIGKGKNTISETIYSLPSRKVFAVDGYLLNSDDIEIDRLANEIEQHDYLMEDTASGKQIRMDTIRALPHSLSAKRLLKEKLSISITQNASKESVGIFKIIKRNCKSLFMKLVNGIKSILSSIELWYDSMKEIEGHFGSGVGTYFKFLRWLFVLNLILLIFTFAFITFPQILFNFYDESFKNSTQTNDNIKSEEFKILDLLTAEGYLNTSILFYGAYTNRSFTIGSSSYSIPHAYFMTMLCLYLCTFVIISSSMARSYRKCYIETSGGIRSMYAHKIFCSWDFGISKKDAAELKHSSIYHELKEILSEMSVTKEKLSKIWKFWYFCSQLIAHLIVGGMITGLGVAMWLLLKQFGSGNHSSWETLYLSLAVNFTMLILQGFFSWIASMEDYRSPRRTLHITLMRNFMLEAVIIGVLLYFWLDQSVSNDSKVDCWETSIGQEIYRLVIVDFFISALIVPLLQVIQTFLIRKFFPSISKPEFDISRKSLGLVFNQTLLWVGLLFSPLLSAVITIKMILMFYIKKSTLIYLCKSPTHLWRSAQTQTLYLVFTFLSLLGVIVSLGYIMTQVKVSEHCGPFQGHAFMFQIFIDGVLKLKDNHWIWRAIMTIARPAVLGGILLTMTVFVYYLRSKSKARGAMVKLLKEMLYLEAKDKEFLLMNITRVTQENREFEFEDDNNETYNPRTNRDNNAESNTTWRYQRSNNTIGEHVLRSRRI